MRPASMATAFLAAFHIAFVTLVFVCKCIVENEIYFFFFITRLVVFFELYFLLVFACICF